MVGFCCRRAEYVGVEKARYPVGIAMVQQDSGPLPWVGLTEIPLFLLLVDVDSTEADFPFMEELGCVRVLHRPEKGMWRRKGVVVDPVAPDEAW